MLSLFPTINCLLGRGALALAEMDVSHGAVLVGKHVTVQGLMHHHELDVFECYQHGANIPSTPKIG
jgi:hypothetical protein